MRLRTKRRLERLGYPPLLTDDLVAQSVTSAKSQANVARDYLAQNTVLDSWQLEDYRACLKWLEENHARVLQPGERAWLYESTGSNVWMKNFPLYSAILELPIPDGEDVNKFFVDHFDEVVSRVIEEVWTSPDCKVANAAEAEVSNLLDGVFDEEALNLIKEEFGKDVCISKLNVSALTHFLRARLVEPKTAHLATPLVPLEVARAVGNKKLLDLQRVINGTLSGMQELTACIHTDASLARVGV